MAFSDTSRQINVTYQFHYEEVRITFYTLNNDHNIQLYSDILLCILFLYVYEILE